MYSFTGQEALLSQKLNNACNKTLHLAFKSVKNRIVHHSRLFGWSIFGLKVCKVLSLIQSNLSVLTVKNTLSPLFSCSGFCSCSLVPVTSKSDRWPHPLTHAITLTRKCRTLWGRAWASWWYSLSPTKLKWVPESPLCSLSPGTGVPGEGVFVYKLSVSWRGSRGRYVSGV